MRTVNWFNAVLTMLDEKTVIGVNPDGSNGDWFQVRDRVLLNVARSDDKNPLASFDTYKEFYIATPEQEANL